MGIAFYDIFYKMVLLPYTINIMVNGYDYGCSFDFFSIFMELLTKEDIEEITLDVVNTFLIPDFNKRNHNASGKWLDSLNIVVSESSSVIRGMDYTQYLVTGSAPQNKSDYELAMWARWAGKNIFTQWVENKGLDLNPYAVAYSIAQSGSKIYRDGGSDFLEILHSKEVQEFIVKKMGGKINVKVRGILLESLKKLK